MIVKANKDVRGGKYTVRFLLENFSDDQIFYLAKYGSPQIKLPLAIYKHSIWPTPEKGFLNVSLNDLPTYEFLFENPSSANSFIDVVIKKIKEEIDLFIARTNDFIGEIAYEVKTGQEIKKIGEGSRKAIDKNSKEYHEIIEKNREAFEKLSKL